MSPLPSRCATTLALLMSLAAPAFAQPQAAASAASTPRPAGNLFNEPFMQLSKGIPGCVAPRGPWLTEEQLVADSHWRANSGVSCYVAGKCRLMNSYMYDKDIGERVKTTFERDGRFDDASIWVHVQRRMVTVMGCVKSAEQAALLKDTMAAIDDVTTVIDQTSVGVTRSPKYTPASAPAGS